VDFTRGFFHLIMVNSFFGGLIIGKIAEGDARHGLKHAAILMTAGYVACSIFILPPPVAVTGSKVNITVVNGDNLVGVPNLPLKDPLQFRVTDESGNPVNSTAVQFKILPSGTVSPSSDTSDKDGFVKVKVVLGDTPGNYFVIASANGNSTRATIIAKDS